MTATVCAWCKAHSNMTPLTRPHVVSGAQGAYQAVQSAFSCNNCQKLSIGSTVVPLNARIPSAVDYTWWDDKKLLRWTPEKVGGREFPDVPQHVAGAADEAFRCRNIDALRSAILLARSVIEATCKDHGVTKGSLAQKIDEMTGKGLIRPFTQDAAHELRYLGNDMAHGDFVDEVDADDAEAVLEVMAEILNEVYQGPARVRRMKAKRTATGNGAIDAPNMPAVRSGAEFSGAGE